MVEQVYIIPVGMILAITNRQVGLKYVHALCSSLLQRHSARNRISVITELIIGYMLPGRPVAMMMFKVGGLASCCVSANG